jgi:hypothetical protein
MSFTTKSRLSRQDAAASKGRSSATAGSPNGKLPAAAYNRKSSKQPKSSWTRIPAMLIFDDTDTGQAQVVGAGLPIVFDAIYAEPKALRAFAAKSNKSAS